MTCSMAGHAQDLSIAMTGDVMMGTTFPSIMLPAHEGRDLFKDAKDILSAADLASETVVVLRSGKKRYALLKFV